MLLRFIRKNSVIITFFFLILISLMLMSVDVKKRGKLNMLEELTIDSFSAAQNVITYTARSLKNIWFGYIYLVGIREENVVLRREVSILRNRLNAGMEILHENQRLKGLLDFKEGSGFRTVTARVIGIGLVDMFETITIGKGSIDGVTSGMAVVTNDGVVGRILSSSPNSSRVLLIADKNSYVDAVIQRSRDRGVVRGEGLNLLELKYLPRSADALAGDMLVTSGVGGVFPKGVVIGSISRVDKNAGGIFLYSAVKPAVDFSKLEEVLVITDHSGKVGYN